MQEFEEDPVLITSDTKLKPKNIVQSGETGAIYLITKRSYVGYHLFYSLQLIDKSQLFPRYKRRKISPFNGTNRKSHIGMVRRKWLLLN